MKRRQRVIAIGTLSLLAIVLAAFWLQPPHPCRTTFEQVRKGMTLREVCATVGGPPGDYSNQKNTNYEMWRHGLFPSQRSWGGRDATLIVWLDDHEIVTYMTIEDVEFRQSVFGRLCKWLGL